MYVLVHNICREHDDIQVRAGFPSPPSLLLSEAHIRVTGELPEELAQCSQEEDTASDAEVAMMSFFLRKLLAVGRLHSYRLLAVAAYVAASIINHRSDTASWEVQERSNHQLHRQQRSTTLAKRPSSSLSSIEKRYPPSKSLFR